MDQQKNDHKLAAALLAQLDNALTLKTVHYLLIN
jgi:hypothetical protein